MRVKRQNHRCRDRRNNDIAQMVGTSRSPDLSSRCYWIWGARA